MFSITRIPGIAVLVTIAAFAAAPGIGRAGDAAELEILGFSEDGRYFALEQYGNADGTGAAYSWIDFYDVGEGCYADGAPRVVVGGREGHDLGLEETRSAARTQAVGPLERLGIRVGNAGKRVICRPLTDLAADSTSARFSVWTPLQGRIGQDYTVELELHPAKTDRCYFGEQAYKFDLRLTDNISGKRTLLHHDEHLPEDRNCALAYRIADVVAYGPVAGEADSATRIVILINVFSTGFEGHDMRYTVVGGTLD